MTMRVGDWQSESDMEGIPNSCDVDQNRFLIYQYQYIYINISSTSEDAVSFCNHHDNEHATWLRILEAAASIRFLKLCRYYEGAGLLVRALSKSVEQLFVPLFMLSIMVICFSTILYEVEYDRTIHDCNSHWLAQNVSAAFLRARPAGVAWSCDVCTTDFSEIVGSIDEGREQCNTCNGYPDGHPECVGVPFGQQFPNIPACMWSSRWQ